VLAAHPPSGYIGDALTAVHYQPGRIASFAMLQSGGSFDFSQSPGSVCAMLLGDNATDWTDPVEHLGLRGAPLAGLCCEDDPRYWLDWPGGYFPRGLGLLDMALWARSHVPDFVVADCDCKVTGLPPWWDGASGQAEAEERLASHLEQLTFWWADLLHHIRRTGWW